MKQIKTMEIILEVSGMLLALIGIFSIAFTGQMGFETIEDIVYFLIYLALYAYCGFCFGKTIYRKS